MATMTKLTAVELLGVFRDAQVDAERQHAGLLVQLEGQAHSGQRAQEIEHTVQALLGAELRVQFLKQLANGTAYGVKDGQDDETIRTAVRLMFLDVLTNGADDEWSGRNNDLRRAGHDSLRELIHRLQYSL